MVIKHSRGIVRTRSLLAVLQRPDMQIVVLLRTLHRDNITSILFSGAGVRLLLQRINI